MIDLCSRAAEDMSRAQASNQLLLRGKLNRLAAPAWLIQASLSLSSVCKSSHDNAIDRTEPFKSTEATKQTGMYAGRTVLSQECTCGSPRAVQYH